MQINTWAAPMSATQADLHANEEQELIDQCALVMWNLALTLVFLHAAVMAWPEPHAPRGRTRSRVLSETASENNKRLAPMSDKLQDM